MSLIALRHVDSFERHRSVNPTEISDQLIHSVRSLDEREELEPWLMAILNDTNRTPHGPSEIVDIFTHKLTVSGHERLAAFILKGKSFPTVRPSHVSHQIFRLNRITGLSIAVFAASGNVLDEVKEEFLHTAQAINCDYIFLDANDIARIMIGYGYLCPRDGNRILSGKCMCGYTPTTHPSNILQQEALRCLAESHENNERSGAIILPTGSGKTRVAVTDTHRQNLSTIVYTAHTNEILEDAEREFLRHFPAADVSRFVKPPTTETLKRVNLISIQTLSRNLNVFEGVAVDYMVIDEFHHAAAKSYRNSIVKIAPNFLLGLTATPFRSDQQDVLNICNNNVLIYYDLKDGINLGILSPYHYFGYFDDIDYSKIEHNGIRYDIRDLERKLLVPERHRAIVEKWKEKAEGKATIAFCCSHQHAVRIAAAFQNAGVASETYLSTHDSAEREKMRDAFRQGRIKVICAVDILNEGIDLPYVECLLFVRPTESKRVFFQQLGRGLRHHVGKEACIVIDFIGNFRNAYRVAEYLGLDPVDDAPSGESEEVYRDVRPNIEHPNGCTVEFDERVIDVFGFQTLNPAYATRQNIDRILIFQYRRLGNNIEKAPTKLEVDRYCLLSSELYVQVFGSWERFLEKMKTLDS